MDRVLCVDDINRCNTFIMTWGVQIEKFSLYITNSLESITETRLMQNNSKFTRKEDVSQRNTYVKQAVFRMI